MHILLALATCLWLYIAQKLNISFEITVVVAVAITLCGGFVTSIRANGVFRRGAQAAAQWQAQTREREAELNQLIFSLPALFWVFLTLQPRAAQPGPFQMYEFANWLRWAVCNGNVVDWMMRRPDRRGRQQMLRGLTGGIEPEHRQEWEVHLEKGTQAIFSEMRLYYQHGDGQVQRGSQRARQDDVRQRPRAKRRAHSAGRRRVATAA